MPLVFEWRTRFSHRSHSEACACCQDEKDSKSPLVRDLGRADHARLARSHSPSLLSETAWNTLCGRCFPHTGLPEFIPIFRLAKRPKRLADMARQQALSATWQGCVAKCRLSTCMRTCIARTRQKLAFGAFLPAGWSRHSATAGAEHLCLTNRS